MMSKTGTRAVFADSVLILRAAERLRPTCSFTQHASRGFGSVMARVGDVVAWGETQEAATRALARQVTERLAAQIDHDTQLMRQLSDALDATD